MDVGSIFCSSKVITNPPTSMKKSLSLEKNRLLGTKCLSAQIAFVQYCPRHDLRLGTEGTEELPFSHIVAQCSKLKITCFAWILHNFCCFQTFLLGSSRIELICMKIVWDIQERVNMKFDITTDLSNLSKFWEWNKALPKMRDIIEKVSKENFVQNGAQGQYVMDPTRFHL